MEELAKVVGYINYKEIVDDDVFLRQKRYVDRDKFIAEVNAFTTGNRKLTKKIFCKSPFGILIVDDIVSAYNVHSKLVLGAKKKVGVKFHRGDMANGVINEELRQTDVSERKVVGAVRGSMESFNDKKYTPQFGDIEDIVMCSKKRFSKIAQDLFDNGIILRVHEKDYEASDIMYNMECRNCSHRFYDTVQGLKRRKIKCPKCRAKESHRKERARYERRRESAKAEKEDACCVK